MNDQPITAREAGVLLLDALHIPHDHCIGFTIDGTADELLVETRHFKPTPPEGLLVRTWRWHRGFMAQASEVTR